MNTEALALVQNQNTSAEILDQLSRDENPFIRVRVAAHLNTSAQTLVKLSKDEAEKIWLFRGWRIIDCWLMDSGWLLFSSIRFGGF